MEDALLSANWLNNVTLSLLHSSWIFTPGKVALIKNPMLLALLMEM
jgi:hypothetical protein